MGYLIKVCNIMKISFCFSGNSYLHNAYFKVVNENSNLIKENSPVVLNEQVQVVVDQKKVPSILKRSPQLVLNGKQPSIVIPESTKGGKIAICPLPQTKYNGASNYQVKVSCNMNYWMFYYFYHFNICLYCVIKYNADWVEM